MLMALKKIHLNIHTFENFKDDTYSATEIWVAAYLLSTEGTSAH